MKKKKTRKKIKGYEYIKKFNKTDYMIILVYLERLEFMLINNENKDFILGQYITRIKNTIKQLELREREN